MTVSMEVTAASTAVTEMPRIKDILERKVLIQTVVKEILKEGEHYGKIPGTKKNVLLKSGAEVISATFQFRIKIEPNDIILRDLGGGHREYEIYCHVCSPNGDELATGLGSCNTMEGKYRYRTGPVESTGRQVPKEYWDYRQSNPAKAQELIGGKGFEAKKNDGRWEIVIKGEKMDHDNPADYFNTVLKMAKKRSFVDGIITATACSDIFTQDVEEMEELLDSHVKKDKAEEAQHQAQPKKNGNGSGNGIPEKALPEKDKVDWFLKKINESRNLEQLAVVVDEIKAYFINHQMNEDYMLLRGAKEERLALLERLFAIIPDSLEEKAMEFALELIDSGLDGAEAVTAYWKKHSKAIAQLAEAETISQIREILTGLI
ncbi:MAG: hypothetical protein HQM11_07935 [SAR324 cluster bacterium]|nr:hypothetical protein [SAR324 cluster bacterium]